MLSPVRKMFDEISERYDFLNHTLSCFRDIAWRRACCRELKKYNPYLKKVTVHKEQK